VFPKSTFSSEELFEDRNQFHTSSVPEALVSQREEVMKQQASRTGKSKTVVKDSSDGVSQMSHDLTTYPNTL
jgi:hypothetical protein